MRASLVVAPSADSDFFHRAHSAVFAANPGRSCPEPITRVSVIKVFFRLPLRGAAVDAFGYAAEFDEISDNPRKLGPAGIQEPSLTDGKLWASASLRMFPNPLSKGLPQELDSLWLPPMPNEAARHSWRIGQQSAYDIVSMNNIIVVVY